MNRWMIALMAGLLGLVALGVLGAPTVADDEAAAPQSDGYSAAVRLFIRNGWLTTAGPRVVELSPAGRADEDARLFYENSFLRSDIARNDPSLWVIDSVLIDVSPFAHTPSSPFAAERWRGDLTLAETASVVELARSDGAAFRLRPKRLENAEDRAGIAVDVYGPAAARTGAVLQLYAGRGRAASDRVASIELIGDTPVVATWSDRPEGRVLIDGVRRPVGSRTALEPGSRLTVQSGRRSASFLVRGQSTGAFSVMQPLGQRRRHPALEAIAARFESAMDAVAARDPAQARTSFVSTLDIGRHLSTQSRLEQAMTGTRAPGAVTVMNALTGEVLVLASTPGPQAGADRSEASRRYRDVINYNFQPMAVGSAAKPVVAAAILARTPALVDLQVRQTAPATPMAEILGVGFGGDPRNLPGEEAGFGEGHFITLEEFIQHSSNRYAASLALLGWSPNPLGASPEPSLDSYRIGPAPRPALPLEGFRIERNTAGERVFGARIGPIPWRDNLRRLYDLGPCAYAEAGRCADSLWRGASTLLQARGPARPAQFAAISPQQQDFAFDRIADVRTDYLPLILGGENYGWSTLKLAESYGRIVTGRRLQARLLRGPPEVFAPLTERDLPSGVRQRLMTALTLVTEPGGTAYSRMRPALERLRAEAARRGERVAVYSKTGTPEIDQLSFTRQEEAENELIRNGLVLVRDGRMEIAGVIPQSREGERQAERRLAADRRAGAILRRYGASAARAVRRAAAYNQAAPGERWQHYRIRSGAVTQVTPRAAPVSKFASAYAAVVVVYPAGSDTPSRAIALAINLQDERRNAPVLAAALLQDDLFGLIFPRQAAP